MALPKTWRICVYNDSGVTLDFSTNEANEACKVTLEKWYAKSGKIEHIAEVELDAATDLADGAVEALTTQSVETNVGFKGVIYAKTDNADATGDIVLFLEWSTDGGTTWPSAASGFDPDEDTLPVCILALGGAVERSRPFVV